MKKKLLFIIIFLILFAGGVIFGIWKSGTNDNTASASVSRTNLALDLDFGNNDGDGSTPTVYDTSGFNRNATSSASFPPTCYTTHCYMNSDRFFLGYKNVWNSSELSIAIKFKPNFSADEAVSRYLYYDSTTWYILRNSTGSFLFRFNGTLVSIAAGNWEYAWKEDEENILIVTATSGDNNVWLNGNKILDGNANAWSVGEVGSTPFIGLSYIGDMYYFKLWRRLLTANEVETLSADRSVQETSPSVVSTALDLDFGNTDGEGTPTIYDSSGFSRFATSAFAMACTADFCDFDGTDRASLGSSNLLNSAELSIAIKFSPDFEADDGNSRYLYDSIDGQRYLFVKAADTDIDLWFANTAIAVIPLATYQPYWKVGEENILVIRSTSGDTDMWLNGNAILTDDNTAWTPDNPSTLYIASGYTGNLRFNGKIYYMKVWQRLLTDNEVANLGADRSKVSNTIPRNGLVGYWDMEPDNIFGTTVYDSSGRNNHGTMTGGGAGGAPTSTAGKIAQAIDFDGSNGYIANMGVATTYAYTSQAFTTCSWVKMDGLTGSANEIIANDDGSNGWGLLVQASNKIRFLTRGTSPAFEDSATIIENNVWTHICGVFTGTNGNHHVYINGSEDVLLSITGSITAANDALHIGIRADLDNVFDGAIDEVMIWNRALSAAEVAQVYNYTVNYVR